MDEREKARLEKIEEWKLSLPKSDKELLELTRNYSRRHEQPRSKISRLKGKISNLCHKIVPDKFKYYCAAKDSRHDVPYYDSGNFTYICNYCKAELLKSEKEAMEEHRWGKCCGYGTVDTELMRSEYRVMQIPLLIHIITSFLKELNNPPPPPSTSKSKAASEFSVKDLSLYAEPSLRNNFLNNTMRLNSMHAFGSIQVGRVIFMLCILKYNSYVYFVLIAR